MFPNVVRLEETDPVGNFFNPGVAIPKSSSPISETGAMPPMVWLKKGFFWKASITFWFKTLWPANASIILGWDYLGRLV